MSSKATVRTFQPSEWRTYKEIRLRALQDSPDAFGSTFDQARKHSDQAWQQRLENAAPETNHPMAAEVDGLIVGLAWAKIEAEDPDATHLYQMWVDPMHRGKAIGKALVLAAIVWARAQSSTQMILDVTCGDRPARRLYDKLGFKPIGTPIPMRPGSDLLEQTMVLELNNSETS